MKIDEGVSDNFSDILFKYQEARNRFEDGLYEASGFEQFETIGGDAYDISIEFYGVASDAKLSEAAQKFIWDAGFTRCWLNHLDCSETYYSWNGSPARFTPVEGSRRKQFRKEDAA